MPLAVPNELKKIKPYILRAEELDKDKSSPESRLVSYYCRQYAVLQGIPLAGQSAESKACLGQILGNLEEEKPAMDNFTRDEAAFLCRKFARKVFEKANGEDLMGLANKNTARTFYAASTFLQILEQFSEGEDSEEWAEDKKKIIYSKWKSTEILKAIQEGRTPTPGGYGEEEEEEGEDAERNDNPPSAPAVETVVASDDELDLPSAPVPPPAPVPPTGTQVVEDDSEDEAAPQEVDLGPPPAYPGPEPSAPPPTSHSFDRPPVTYEVPKLPAPQPPHPPVQRPTPPPVVEHHPVPPSAPRSGIFGHKVDKVTRSQLSDAVEMTRFALAALEDRDVDLGVERLRQALSALGR